jgi:hypothetical protein
MAQGTKYPCTMGYHILYHEPLGNTTQNVLERVTECIKHNEHKNVILFYSFLKLMNLFIFYQYLHDIKVMQHHKNKITG